jgi:hypothetical protein
MKNTLLLLLFVSLSTLIYAQDVEEQFEEQFEAQPELPPVKTWAIDAGFMMGGGSLIGVDFEVAMSKKLGFQIGVGISSVGLGLNYHIKNGVNTPFVSLQYLHQGFGDQHYASYFGPVFIYRTKKIFQIGLGFGYILEKGDTWSFDRDISLAILYQIGIYF